MERLVSVIIPAYNAEKYIRSCVESVINQDYKNIEVIVVNDGSIDKTEDVVKSMAEDDSRIVLINQQNKGASAARNNGLQSCKGEYVFFLDSDDWIEEECIGTLLDIAIQKDAEIVFFDYYKNYEDRQVKHHIYDKSFMYETNGSENNYLWDMRTITPWGKLYKRESIGDVLFDEGMRIVEDVDFNFRIYSHVNRAYYLSECLLHYRILPKSAAHGYDPNIKEKFKYSISKIASYMKGDNPIKNEAYYSLLAIAYIVICQNGTVLNDNLNYMEKRAEIKSLNELAWVKDLMANTKLVSIPISRKIIIYCSKVGIYSMMIVAANIRRRLKT